MKMIGLTVKEMGKIKEKKLAEGLFLLGWSLMVIHMYVAYSSLSAYSNSMVSAIALFFFLFKIIYTKYTAKEMIICSILMLIGILTIRPSQDMRVFWFALVIMAAKNVDLEKVIRITYRLTLICCSFFLICFLLNISIDEMIYLENGKIRHGFGLGHPNALQAYVLYIATMMIYVNYVRLKRWILVTLFFLSMITYYFTNSRTGIIITIIILATAWLIRFSSFNKLTRKGIRTGSFLYIAIFSLLPIIYFRYMNPVFSLLNSLLTNRISQAGYFYSAYGIKLFGFRPIELTYKKRYIYLDMGYEAMYINQGFIYFIIIVGSMLFLLHRYAKEKNDKRMLILFSFILFLGPENMVTYIFLNVSMLFISELIFVSKPSKEVEKRNINTRIIS